MNEAPFTTSHVSSFTDLDFDLSREITSSMVEVRSRSDEEQSLQDLLYEGFYVIFLLRNGYQADDPPALRQNIRDLITRFKRNAEEKLKATPVAMKLSTFAFIALLDETVLTSQTGITRDIWEMRPLQLELFGEQLAGERFFRLLDTVRQAPHPDVEVLEVFHMCLLMGFQGKFITEGSEKLEYLTTQLGNEIAHLKGHRASFAPHALPTESIVHKLKYDIPWWVITSGFVIAGLLTFTGLNWWLSRQTDHDLSQYSKIVQVPSEPAYISITLP